MEYVKRERKLPVCLECGDKIRYGRSDKKFCCEDCKTRHYNKQAKGSRAYRRRVISRLSRNYQVLERILRSGESSAEIMDMSFAIQALSAKYLVEHQGQLDSMLIDVPEEVDLEVAEKKLRFLGKEIDVLTPEQEKYLNESGI